MKSTIKTITGWLIKNFWNFFNVLGLILTVYFGIFYVPSWLTESQNERLKNAQSEIQQSVKELVFSDSTFTIQELRSLVHAKEITLKEKFPLSLSDILTKSEESFMEDRYLPLIKRKNLIERLENIKRQIPKKSRIFENRKAESKSFLLTQLLSIIVSIGVVVIGIISTFFKYQSDKDKEEEIKNESVEIISPFEMTSYAYEFEKQIESILRHRNDIELLDRDQERGIDFEFIHKKRNFFIEAKFLSRSKIGLTTFHQLRYYLRGKSGEAWLVYNTDLTPLVAKEIDDFNKNNPEIKIKAIRVKNAKEFEEKLDDLLN